MSSPVPINRAELAELRAKIVQEQRIASINNIIRSIYNYVINAAKSTSDTKYNYIIQQYEASFMKENMKDIMVLLQQLFPDCQISHTLLARGIDGEMYDISKLDDTSLPLVNQVLNNSYIVIDWS